jgi:Response regulator containing a CheY-like receiver domain and an HTH DNA-binding domain
MNSLNDEPKVEAITVVLVEDDAPTLWRLQDALSQGRVSGQGRRHAHGSPRLSRARRAKSAADRSSTARWPRRRPDPRNAAALSRHRDHGDLDPRRRGERDLRDHRRRDRLSAQGRLSDRYRRHRARLVAGHSPISASIARFIVRRTQNTPEPPPGPALNTAKLTPREIDILWGIAKGFSYAEIASHLSLSRQTVPGHIKNIYRKLEVHTRGEAVFEAVQQGLIKL